MLENILPYDEDQWRSQFEPTVLGQRLAQDWDHVSYSYHFRPRLDACFRPHQSTNREMWGRGYGDGIYPPPQQQMTNFSAVPFYYMQWLDRPGRIWDLGCGWNIFSRYLPNIWGVSNEIGPSRYSHERVDMDAQWHQRYQHQMANAMSICSLHFRALQGVRYIVMDFARLLAPKGRGFIAMNLQRLLDHDPESQTWSQDRIEHEIRLRLKHLPFEVLVFDLDFSQYDNVMDGNIRMVLEGP